MADIDVVRKAYDAFIAGDMDTVRSMFADDATWTVTGNGAISGTKEGADAIMAYFEELFSKSDGTMVVSLLDLAAGEDHVLSLQRQTARRNDGSLDVGGVIVWQVRDGLLWKVVQYFEAPETHDAFWE